MSIIEYNNRNEIAALKIKMKELEDNKGADNGYLIFMLFIILTFIFFVIVVNIKDQKTRIDNIEKILEEKNNVQ